MPWQPITIKSNDQIYVGRTIKNRYAGKYNIPMTILGVHNSYFVAKDEDGFMYAFTTDTTCWLIWEEEPKVEEEKVESKIECAHCKGDTRIRNPSGYCDHLYYPENCEVCKKRNPHLGSSFDDYLAKEPIEELNYALSDSLGLAELKDKTNELVRAVNRLRKRKYLF